MRVSEWVPAVVAAVAFVGVAVVFARETTSFRRAVLDWAGNDLDSRTRIAVETLREPLQSGDFAAVHRFSAQCAVDDVRLSVFGRPRGLVFDSLGAEAARRDGEFLFGPRLDAGAFSIRLALPLDRVLAPFRRARLSFLFAALLGMSGVLLFFFVIYRQRVRLREMARLERFRREFIADVSHEIKTPLTGILGAVDMMEEVKVKGGGGGGEWTTLLSLVKKEAKRLNGLVQQILDLSRLDREGEVLQKSETDLAALVREVAARFGVKFAMDGVSESISPGRGRPGHDRSASRSKGVLALAERPFVCDPQLIEEALSNLIGNAKRHSGTDDIAVTLACTGRDVTVSVEDHGVGIPPEHAERIFERFHRVDPARAAETGGAGLGLAIVRRIARLHGGDVACRPACPHGSVFILTLPF